MQTTSRHTAFLSTIDGSQNYMRVLKSQQLWPLLDCTRLAVLYFVDICFFVPFMRTICEVSALPRYETWYSSCPAVPRPLLGLTANTRWAPRKVVAREGTRPK